MAENSSYPTSLDNAGDLRALVPTDAAPVGFQDFLQLLADAVTEIQTLLGITTSPQGLAQPFCEMSDVANSVANNSNVVIGSSATESTDTHGYHSDVTNPSRLTVPTGLGGTHMTFGRTSFATHATGHRRVNVQINGGSVITISQVNAVDTAGATTVLANFWVGRLSAGDYIELNVLQNTGGALNVTMSNFGIVRLGP